MLVKVSFRLTIGDLIDSTIMQILTVPFAKDMVRILMGTAESMSTGAEAAPEAPAAEEATYAPPAQPAAQQQPMAGYEQPPMTGYEQQPMAGDKRLSSRTDSRTRSLRTELSRCRQLTWIRRAERLPHSAMCRTGTLMFSRCNLRIFNPDPMCNMMNPI